MEGVLKTLVQKKRGDDKARRRMNQEVGNLQLLASTAAKIPKILETNTHDFANTQTELYFVMDYIPGGRRCDLISPAKPLLPDAAIEVAIDLCRTIKACHDNGVMHRDLKPANIIVRTVDPPDSVVVDYGLSFNEDEETENDLTSLGEPIGNGFTDLPERRTPGTQRRYESDLTAVCGILYHCITGQQPSPWRDAHGKAPHRREAAHLSLHPVMNNHSATKRLESVLDRAFDNIENRFSSADDLIERLTHAKAGPTSTAPQNLDALIAKRSEELLKGSRQVQLQRFGESAHQAVAKITSKVMVQEPQSEFICRIQIVQQGIDAGLPSTFTQVGVAFGVVVQVRNIKEYSLVAYALRQANQVALLRRRFTPAPQKAPLGFGFFGSGDRKFAISDLFGQSWGVGFEPIEEWQPLSWYQVNGEPGEGELDREIHESIEWQMTQLIERLQG